MAFGELLETASRMCSAFQFYVLFRLTCCLIKENHTSVLGKPWTKRKVLEVKKGVKHFGKSINHENRGLEMCEGG